MADLAHAAGIVDPVERRRAACRRGAIGLVGRVDAVLREQVQDIHQDQFLMLLLVVQAEHDQRRSLGPDGCRRGGDEAFHRRVDMGAIGGNVGRRGARQHAALRPRMPVADGVVIGIEQVGVVLVEDLVSRGMGAEHEGLEKPGNMRAVPLRRAGVGHRLDDLVLVGQRRGQPVRLSADIAEAGEQRIAVAGACAEGIRGRHGDSHAFLLTGCLAGRSIVAGPRKTGPYLRLRSPAAPRRALLSRRPASARRFRFVNDRRA